MEVPALREYVSRLVRIHPYTKKEVTFFTPNTNFNEFWRVLYKTLEKKKMFQPPVRSIDNHINPYFGYFGNRVNPKTLEMKDFHTGIDLEGTRNMKVYAAADGVLEYAGFGVMNGYYVLLSHPTVVSEDGFRLESLYIHLRELEVGFTSYQKMLREISLHTYPSIQIPRGTALGKIGATGDSQYPDKYTHTHFQLQFTNKQGERILVDPARALGLEKTANITADCSTKKEIFDIYNKYRKDIHVRKLEEIWKNRFAKS